MLSERQRRVLEIIAAHEHAVTGRDIADELGVSVRTVQAEVARINTPKAIITSSNKGYRLAHRPDADRLGLHFGPLPATEHGASSELHELLKILLADDASNETPTAGDLSERLYISIPAVERRLRLVRPLLQEYGIALVRRRGGIELEGDERDKRRLIGHLVTEEAGASFSNWELIASSFGNLDVNTVKAAVTQALDERGYRIRTGYEQNLITTIAIALERIHLGSNVLEDAHTGDVPGIDCASDICRRCSHDKDPAPSAGDLVYLASLLAGQVEPSNLAIRPASDIEASGFVRRIEHVVNSVFESFSLHIDFSQALYNFSQHMHALIDRASGEQISDTETLENVKMNCPFVYELSVLIAQGLADEFGINIEDGEIGFICIHVGMLIEGTTTNEKVRIALLCDQYQSISERIRREIERRFAGIATVIVDEHPGDDSLAHADLVVTTRRALSGRNGVVFVSPFSTSSDFLKIENAIGLCLKRKHSERMQRLLVPFFDQELFFHLDRSCERDDIIRFLGGQLHNKGIVNEDFIESVLTREQLSPTSFFNLFALPHAIEMNATRTMVAVLVNNQGMSWGDETVRAVLMIAVSRNDRKQFMEIYDTIARTLCDERRVRRITQANTLEEFLDLLTYA